MKILIRLAMTFALLSLAACSTPRPVASSNMVPLNHLAAISGDYFPILSTSTGSKYHIYIRYPEGYSSSAQRYPVVYLLDGDASFPYLAPHHLLLTFDDKLPEAIIVGIAYGSFAEPVNRRGLDFGEGSAAFHSFLKREPSRLSRAACVPIRNGGYSSASHEAAALPSTQLIPIQTCSGRGSPATRLSLPTVNWC
ncbi:MAG TPA: alpha/beta hydrolase-fold protein [Allosphingosinicella sp.]|nr:alpha/beta hydrolase-fold protein [Allosphingosinicella sp.]